MKNFIIIFLFLLFSSIIFGQKYIDKTEEFSDMNGHLIIDGNELQYKYDTREQIIITGKDMVLNDRSSFLFNNVIVQLSGDIEVKGRIRPTLVDSYIFCKDAGPLISDKIVEVKNFDDVVIADVEYIRKLRGDPELRIYDIQGKSVFKGSKSEAKNFKLPISRYDVKVIGYEYANKVLFATK